MGTGTGGGEGTAIARSAGAEDAKSAGAVITVPPDIGRRGGADRSNRNEIASGEWRWGFKCPVVG
jgi:hypothetical protein